VTRGIIRGLVGFACLAVVGAFTAPAASAKYAEFEVEGTNGYKVFFGIDSFRGEAAAYVAAYDELSGAFYSPQEANGTATAHRFNAEIGDLGRVDVAFEESSRRTRRVPGCKGRLVIARGTFEGEFSFAGEGGFTVADGTSATGRLTSSGNVHDCRGIPGTGGKPAPRDTIALGTCRQRSEAEYYAFKRRGEVIHLASEGDVVGALEVWRTTGVEAGPSTFATSRNLREATVQPPPPFAGTAHLADRRLSGDLTTTFPGLADPVPLTPARGRLSRQRDLTASSPCSTVIVIESARRGRDWQLTSRIEPLAANREWGPPRPHSDG
jgi:hypothetical protein